jgi:eukaryotic-like serine/threonine-protein kinase
MHCPDDTIVQRFVEGQLQAGERGATEAHLSECSECRRLVSQLARTAMAPESDAFSEALTPGVLLGGRFVLERRLGGGGMGTVWAARHQVTHQRVALKLVRGVVGERERKRFLREARVASAFEHPNIAVARDAFELDDGTPVLVMELLLGRSLRERLTAGGRMSAGETAAVLGEVAEAIAAAHARQVVHRDLKPDNIFLCDDPGAGAPTVKVLDFGIAKLHGGASGDITRTGDLLGTPYYMAPEQLFGESDIDGSADVWALGVTAFECLTGRRPFEGDGVGGLLKAIGGGTAPALDALTPLPAAVNTLVRHMLSVERKRRPSMTEVRAALRTWTAASPAPAKSKRTGTIAAVATVLLVALGLLGWRLTHSPATSSQSATSASGADTTAPLAASPTPPQAAADPAAPRAGRDPAVAGNPAAPRVGGDPATSPVVGDPAASRSAAPAASPVIADPATSPVVGDPAASRAGAGPAASRGAADPAASRARAGRVAAPAAAPPANTRSGGSPDARPGDQAAGAGQVPAAKAKAPPPPTPTPVPAAPAKSEERGPGGVIEKVPF